jgi:hypothetical protein
MAVDHALWCPGGARSIEDVGCPVRRDFEAEVLIGDGCFELVDPDHSLPVDRQMLKQGQACLVGHEKLGLRVVQDGRDPLGRIGRIDRHIDFTRLQHGENRRHGGSALLQEERNRRFPVATAVNNLASDGIAAAI